LAYWHESFAEEEAVAQVKERLSQLFDAQSLGFVHEAPTAAPPEEEAVAQVKERLSQLFDAQSLGFVHEAPTAAPLPGGGAGGGSPPSRGRQ